MMRPEWSGVDDERADLLTLVANDSHPSSEFEWDEFVTALRHARTPDNLIQPNTLRPLVRGIVAPKRIGAFTRRACFDGLIKPTGDWQVSDDTEGGNAGRPAKVYRWTGAEL